MLETCLGMIKDFFARFRDLELDYGGQKLEKKIR